jgi:hypothetical protein
MPKALSAPLSLALASLTAADLAAAPRYRMKMGENQPEQGVNLVSIVQNPAIGRGFVALSALKTAPKRVHLSTEPTQQVLTGPALVPDEEILRLDAKGKPYYISFSAEEISQIKRRYAVNGYQKLSNHEHQTPLDSIVFEESWIVRDSERDPAAVLGLDVPVGTWMLSAHIADAEFWANEVLTGNVTGFSIEGLFDTEEVTLAAVPASTSPMKKTWFQRLSTAAMRMLKLSVVTLKDGSQLDIASDGTVSKVDEDGQPTEVVADGSYILDDDSELLVKEGKKAEAPEKEKEVAATDEAVTAAQEVLKEITAETTAADAKAIVEKALKALGGEAPAEKTPEEVKASAVPLFLEAVEMLDGSSLYYNPISRLLTDANGVPVPSGYHACKDGSFFRVETSQYTYTIDAETYAKATTQLSEVKVKLEAAELQLSQTPDGGRVLLSGAGNGNNQRTSEKPKPTHERYALAAVAGAIE